MTDESSCKIVCSSCKLEAEAHFPDDRPYTITFDSSQFVEKCRSTKRMTSFACGELDVAISGRSLPLTRNV